MRNILYTLARDETGDLIRATDAEKGCNYFCGYCQNPFVLRKSGKTGPRTKRPHFAHKADASNCSPETALHFEFKNLLFKSIESRLNNGLPFGFSWDCVYCDQRHSGNLLKKARSVGIEHSLGTCRPDLVLFDDKGEVVAAIEVVVTHLPEDAAREYYRSNRIAVVEYHVSSEDDLHDIEVRFSLPDRVDLCTYWERCNGCGHFRQPILMRIFEAHCYGCRSKIKIPFIQGDDWRGTHAGPDKFSREERDLATKYGALIQWQYSNTLNTKYWAATCTNCKKFVGRNHLFTEYIVPALYGECSIQDIRLGHYCQYCGGDEADEGG